MLPLLVGRELLSICGRPRIMTGLRFRGLPPGLAVGRPDFVPLLPATDEVIDAFDAPVPFCGLPKGESFAGVSGRNIRLEAYGSAVCGRCISGLLGRRTGPDIKELPFLAALDDPWTSGAALG